MINQPPRMPPTTDPASLIRRAKTSQIQNSFQSQPPRMPPIQPPEHITPIGTGQSDGMITPMPGSWNQQGPTRQPPHPAGPQPFAYSAFQNALRASGRDFGNPAVGIGGGTPNPAPIPRALAEGGGFQEPALPVSDPMSPGPHDELGLDPGGANYPGGNPDPIGSSGSEPPPDGTQDPPNLYAPPYGGGEPESPYDPASGIGNSPPPTGNDFPTFGGGPWAPSQGGVVGTGTTDPRPWYNQRNEPWYGRVARSIIPYGAGQLTHVAARALMANRGRVGAAAHVAGGPRSPNASQQYASGTPGSPGYQAAGQHFDYARGRVMNDRDPGRGFAGSPNQGAEQQARSPRAFGMNSVGDSGRGINTFDQAMLARRVDPATAAALRAWSAAHTTVGQVYGGG